MINILIKATICDHQIWMMVDIELILNCLDYDIWTNTTTPWRLGTYNSPVLERTFNR